MEKESEGMREGYIYIKIIKWYWLDGWAPIRHCAPFFDAVDLQVQFSKGDEIEEDKGDTK